jgi:hypothetical protein
MRSTRFLKSEILFLVDKREFRPDIIGVLKLPLSPKLVTIEVKKKEIELYDWFQARNYGDLYDASIALLVSPVSVPEKIRRLIEYHHALQLRPCGYGIYHARLMERTLTEFSQKSHISIEPLTSQPNSCNKF